MLAGTSPPRSAFHYFRLRTSVSVSGIHVFGRLEQQNKIVFLGYLQNDDVEGTIRRTASS